MINMWGCILVVCVMTSLVGAGRKGPDVTKEEWDAKRTYDFIMEGLEVKGSDVLIWNSARIERYNRSCFTCMVFNANLTLLQDLTLDIMASGALYPIIGNRVSPLPIRLPNDSMCAMLKQDMAGGIYNDLREHSNMPVIEDCFFRKGEYFIREYKPDPQKWPPSVPGNKWKVEARMHDQGKFILSMRFTITIKRLY